MKSFVAVIFFVVIVCLLPPSILTDSGLRAPPHITGELDPEHRVKVGDTVKIDCPIDSILKSYYEWYKDGEAITGAWDRFRVSAKKLRIKGVLAEDGGLIVCKAVNGFGSKELSTRLLVTDERGVVVGGAQDKSNEEPKSVDEIVGTQPSLVEITRPKFGPTFRQSVGSSLTLKCKVDGQPLPNVSWFKLKDGVQAPKASGQQLELTSIGFNDEGTYLCRAINQYGQVNASFTVQVIERGMEGPSISLEPSNLTVARGQLIHFRCLIRSNTVPSIQWFKELDDLDVNSEVGVLLDGGGGGTAMQQQQMGELKYKLIHQVNRMTTLQNGSYLSELRIDVANSEDSGGYICYATNEGGFNFQKSFLRIVATGEDDGEASSSSDALLPIGVLIAVPATLMLLIIGLALVICCVRRGGSNNELSSTVSSHITPNAGGVTTSSLYATPRDAMDYHHNHHQSSAMTPPHPFYNIRQSTQLPQPPPQPMQRPSHFSNGSQQYFVKENNCPSSHMSPIRNFTSTSPAYASVPICETSSFGINHNNRAPPLPSRPFPSSARDRISTNYNNQGLLTQPLLTQTASSSDSRDSRQSASHRADFSNHRPTTTVVPVDHWCSSGGSDASSDRKHSSKTQQIRL